MSARHYVIAAALLLSLGQASHAQPGRVAPGVVPSTRNPIPRKPTPAEVAAEAVNAGILANWARSMERQRQLLKEQLGGSTTAARSLELVSALQVAAQNYPRAESGRVQVAARFYADGLTAEARTAAAWIQAVSAGNSGNLPHLRGAEARRVDQAYRTAARNMEPLFKQAGIAQPPAIAPTSASYLGYLISITPRKR